MLQHVSTIMTWTEILNYWREHDQIVVEAFNKALKDSNNIELYDLVNTIDTRREIMALIMMSMLEKLAEDENENDNSRQ